jgi:hypothetical protein
VGVLLQGEVMKAGKRVKAQQSAGKRGGGKGAESGEIYKKWLKHGAKGCKDAAAAGKGGASAFGNRYDCKLNLMASHEPSARFEQR